MRQRVWEAANVELREVTLDTDTTVHPVYGRQMGARKGDRPTGQQIAQHLERVAASLPPSVETVYARADSGFYCKEAVEAYEKRGWRFVISAQKTSRLVDELRAARWTGSPRTERAWRRIPRGGGRPTACTSSWPCWPTT